MIAEMLCVYSKDILCFITLEQKQHIIFNQGR